MIRKCCFTGYRPEKLLYLNNKEGSEYKNLKKVLTAAIENAMDEGYNYFISGFARGVDLLCAELVLCQVKKGREVFLEAAIPCLNQTQGWPEADMKKYNAMLEQAHYKVYLAKDGNRGCFLRRNRYMVDSSLRIIGVYDGQKGGTAHTIEYGRRHNREIILIDPHNFQIKRQMPEPSLF